MPRTNIAVILAAGRGTRTMIETPKQLVKLGGVPMISHAITAFQQNKNISEILIVTNDLCIKEIREIVARYGFSKVTSVLLGGSERHDSSCTAIEALSYRRDAQDLNLIFHDAVRPLVSQAIINNVVAALDHYTAVDVAIPTTDTVITVNPVANTIDNIPNRNLLRNGQTPQGFAFETIRKGYELGLKDPEFRTSDDCSVVLKYLPDEPIYVVPGELYNAKMTYADDLYILDKFLQLRNAQIDVPDITLNGLRNKVIVVIGGTSGIGEAICKMASAYNAIVIPASRRSGLDITSSSDLKRFFDEIIAEKGRIDIVINTAAILKIGSFNNLSDDDIEHQLGTNFTAAVKLSRASFEALRQSRGCLIQFTSSSYTYGRAFYSLYSSSKAAVVNFCQAIAEEWDEYGIRVNCVCPERTDTPMRRQAFGAEDPGSLLGADKVARQTLVCALSEYSGQVISVRREMK